MDRALLGPARDPALTSSTSPTASDLRRDIEFNSRVQSAVYDEAASRWQIETEGESGRDALSAKYFVMATGCLSSANTPDFEGLDDFAGNTYHTGPLAPP